MHANPPGLSDRATAPISGPDVTHGPRAGTPVSRAPRTGGQGERAFSEVAAGAWTADAVGSALRSEYAMLEIGRSVEDRPIQLHVFGGDATARPTLIFAAIHGNERNTKPLADRLIQHLLNNPSDRSGRAVAIIPVANPDGWARRTRTNVNRVDVNRNFPALNWRVQREQRGYYGGAEAASEPESRALMEAVRALRPARIVAIHNISGGRECNNFDGPGESLAELMRGHNGYPVLPTIGYPTPGSFGSWAGVDAGIPVITLELPRGSAIDELWPANRDALLAIIRE